MAALVLQGKHHGRQLCVGYGLSQTLMADIMVLTEIAQQVAVREEYGSGSMPSHKRRFFPKVGLKA